MHPDERFLAMTASTLVLPRSMAEYLSASSSPLNPRRASGVAFVYGMLPTTLLRLVADGFGLATASDVTRAGRVLSASFDTLTLLLVYLLATALASGQGLSPAGDAAALCYALAPLPIRQAHFFTPDALLTMLTTLAVWCMLRFVRGGGIAWVAAAGMSAGAAMGTKVSAGVMFPLLLGLLLAEGHGRKGVATAARCWSAFAGGQPREQDVAPVAMPGPRRQGLRRLRQGLSLSTPSLSAFGRGLSLLAIFGAMSLAGWHLADPKAFAGGFVLDPRPSPLFLADLRELARLGASGSSFPPSVQWEGTPPVWFALKNMAMEGLGPVLFACCLIGAARIMRRGLSPLCAVVLFVLAAFLWLSWQPVKPLRYFLPLYPLLAVCAGCALGRDALDGRGARVPRVAALAAFAGILATALGFSAIYTRPHTRVAASRWIYANVPTNSVILTEHWDDAMPLACDGRSPGVYRVRELPVFDPFSQDKLDRIHALLRQGEWLVVSSRRGYGAIPRVPMRFPFMTEFYRRLFAGETPFSLVAVFESYPGWRFGRHRAWIRDDFAEESFTVYDHPRVMVFRRGGQQGARGSGAGGG